MFYLLLVRFCLSFLLTLHFILVSISLLHEKRKELGDAASKLRNGLDKIDDTRAKVWPFVVQFYLTVHELDLFFYRETLSNISVWKNKRTKSVQLQNSVMYRNLHLIRLIFFLS